MSSFTCVVLKRRVGVIGLYVLIAIVFVLKSPRHYCAALPVSPAIALPSRDHRYSYCERQAGLASP